MFTPAPLFPGARVALLCTSSAVPDGRLAPAVAAVRSLGLEPVIYPSCTELHGYFSGDDARRAADLSAAFADESSEGILCARGGDGGAATGLTACCLCWTSTSSPPTPSFFRATVT